jgi:ABC-type amino acid transport system permease subunit
VLDAGLTIDTMKLSIERPLPAHALALALLLASAVAAWLRLRREDVSPRFRAWWIAASLVIGLPALLALMALQGRPVVRRVTTATTALQPA